MERAEAKGIFSTLNPKPEEKATKKGKIFDPDIVVDNMDDITNIPGLTAKQAGLCGYG
jgi:hypothetical protein